MKTNSDSSPYMTDLDYMQDEMDWVEARSRRIGVQNALKALENDEEEGQKPHRFGTFDDELSPDLLRSRARHWKRAEDKARKLVDQRLATTRKQSRRLALDVLCDLYELDGHQRSIVLMACAPCFSRMFEDLFDKLDAHGMSSGLNVETAFGFLEVSMGDRVRLRSLFAPASNLVASDIITLDMGHRLSSPKDLLIADIAITSRTFSFLVGDESLGEEFQEFSSVEAPVATLEQVVLKEADKQRILSVVERHEHYLECRKKWGFDELIKYGRGVLMLFHGKPGTGKTMMAHAIAHQMGKRILNVDIPTFLDKSNSDRFLPGLFREARLQDALLFFDECEVLFGDRAFGNSLMTLLLTELERFEGVAILATNAPQALDEALDRRILVKVRFPEPDRDARLEIWQKHLPATAPMSDDVDLQTLADRYDMAGGYIKNAVLMAVAQAVHSNGETPVISMAHLDKAAHDQLDRPMDDDVMIRQTKVRMDDVILPESLSNQVAELLSAARNRRTVLERWGIGSHLTYGKGISALFHGGPGTGKTLCAEAVAGELSQPLFAVAVSAIFSKWVGETERNLVKYFAKARMHNAVLFLDEADSLLMDRSQSSGHRHDISAVNTLLKLIEQHDGVVLLATNLVETLDKALARRLSYNLHFPFPDASLRRAIWRRLLPETVPTDDIDLPALASLPLTGGHIKNAVFKAAFRAANGHSNLTQELLLQAANEELSALGNGKKAMGFAT